MKKWLPVIIPGLAVLWVLSSLRPPAQGAFHTREFAELPALLNGRIQPLDSVARNTLLQILNKDTVRLPVDKAVKTRQTNSLSAIEWLLETTMNPELADQRRIFRIDNRELVGSLGLPKTNHFSFLELKPHLEEIQTQARHIEGTDEVKGIESQLRTPVQKQIVKLFNALTLYHRLKNSLRPEQSNDFAAEVARYRAVIEPGVAAVRARESGQEFDSAAFDQILEHLGQYDFMSRVSLPLLVPPRDKTQTPDAWENIGTSLMGAARSGDIHPAVTNYAAMATAYHANQPEAFNRAVTAYRAWLKQHAPAQMRKARAEHLFNDFEPFLLAMTLYLGAFLLACAYWFRLSSWLRVSAAGLVWVGFVVHTGGLLFRMLLEGRPPVTNLYSSAIFIGWAAVILGMVLERFYKEAIGIVTAACIGFTTLVIAHNLALGGDTMIMLQAVLDTNFWLATHVVAITLGYASTFVAGFLAILYLVRGVFTSSLSAGTARALARMVYGIVCFATLFSFVGTVLGGIWADQSWGRFWGWDPKENGALLIVLGNAIFLHARWGKLVSEQTLMAMAVVGNIVVSFSWFGVNMLGVGLHAYGFMDEAFKWLVAFCVSQVLIALLAAVPRRHWRSALIEPKPRAPGTAMPVKPALPKPKPAPSAG